jgi:molybdopterin-guanine dinucleotide biosynthesis protein A
VLAADLPFISAAAIDALRLAKGHDAAAIAVDESGQDQPLIGCYDTARLRTACPDVPSGMPMRSLLAELERTGAVHRLGLDGDRPATLDCDTPADLSRAEELA